MAGKGLNSTLQSILPQHFFSRIISRLADCKIPFIKNCLIKAFINHYKVDLSIATLKQVDDYASFNQFFIRALEPASRPIATERGAIASPADGMVTQLGKIKAGKLLQAKGHTYCLKELLGGHDELADIFLKGDFLTIYLAPKDYHRVHMPLEGQLIKTIYVPGRLYSVNQKTTETVPSLFCRNERLICLFKTQIGEMALIMVGAMLVAGIETVWGGQETPCQSRSLVAKDYLSNNLTLAKGDEMGRFQFGSTVILLFRPNVVDLDTFYENQPIKMGAKLGHILV